jgi:TonB family protein
MKKNLFLAVFVCLLAVSAFAQEKKTTDFSGNWELDINKSKLDSRVRIESMKMNVAQTDKDIKIDTTVKRTENNGGGNRGGGMGRGGGMMGGGNSSLTYTLDGKTTEISQDTPMGAIPVALKAKFDDKGNLKLTQTGTVNTQMGMFSIVNKETWTLSDEGKTLTVKREIETPQGSQTSTMVFTKLQAFQENRLTISSSPVLGDSVSLENSQNRANPRTISGGVVNGKARSLVMPKYPEAARAVGASGAVSVAVTIDLEGNVISANAVSGNPLLRAAAEEAARESKFYPTLLEGQPVMVTGTIIYNFVAP